MIQEKLDELEGARLRAGEKDVGGPKGWAWDVGQETRQPIEGDISERGPIRQHTGRRWQVAKCRRKGNS